nr:hypothetical protein [Tanacetum cinerariifolium]
MSIENGVNLLAPNPAHNSNFSLLSVLGREKLTAPVLTVSHNAKKIKTSYSNWKGKTVKGKSDLGSKRKAESDISPTSDPKEALCFHCNTNGSWIQGVVLTFALFCKGCEVFIRRETQDKLEARSEKCLFVGYPEESFVYLLYKPKDNVVFTAQRGVFLEREMISKEDSGSKIDLEKIQKSVDKEPIVNTNTQQEVVTPVKPDDISLPILKTSGRVSKPHHFYYGFYIEEDKTSDSTLSELDEHANYKEAMASPEAAKWKEAIKSKIQSMYDNQMDVKIAFLNEKLTEDVFMAQPEGFENAKMNQVPYASVVGSIMYAMTYTRHDVSFALSMMSRHQQNPGEGHWTAIKNILITQGSRKVKAIERKYPFVRSKVEEGHVIMKQIRSDDNPADPFTKALAKSRHDKHARSIGLKDNIKF